MAAGDICVADLLNTVHHEMDSVSCSHNVICIVASNRATHLGEGACCTFHMMYLQWH